MSIDRTAEVAVAVTEVRLRGDVDELRDQQAMIMPRSAAGYLRRPFEVREEEEGLLARSWGVEGDDWHFEPSSCHDALVWDPVSVRHPLGGGLLEFQVVGRRTELVARGVHAVRIDARCAVTDRFIPFARYHVASPLGSWSEACVEGSNMLTASPFVVADGDTFHLTVWAEGYRHRVVHGTGRVALAEKPMRVQLERGESEFVHVATASGDPLAGATVFVDGVPVGATDAGGACVLEGAVAGDVLSAQAPGHAEFQCAGGPVAWRALGQAHDVIEVTLVLE